MTALLRPAVAVVLGIVLIGAVQAVADRPGQVRTVELVIEHSRYLGADGQPVETLEVGDGATVRFVVHNRDPIAHELIAGDLQTQQRHESGTDRHHDGAHGAVSVAAGATAETVHTFTGTGTHWVGCHLPGHWDYGMRLPVRVAG